MPLASPDTCLLNEGARHPSARQATTPASDEGGALATNHSAATGERRYHITLTCVILLGLQSRFGDKLLII